MELASYARLRSFSDRSRHGQQSTLVEWKRTPPDRQVAISIRRSTTRRKARPLRDRNVDRRGPEFRVSPGCTDL